VFAGAVVAGMALHLVGTSPIRMLFISAVLNGLLAPPLLVLVMLVGNNKAIMGAYVNGLWLNVLGWLATAIMFVAAIAFFLISL
jgi:Mn2+/Fe2+ NRAMP family transporter